MWIWWIVSLIILIGCIVFAYLMIVSSYDFLPAEKNFLSRFGKKQESKNPSEPEYELPGDLQSRLESIEETTTFHDIQFSKFIQRLKSLEGRFEGTHEPHLDFKSADEEDWKELYYEENEKKEKIENELDETRQLLESNELLLLEFRKNKSDEISVISDHETSASDLESMQQSIQILQQQIVVASEREKELEQLLHAEIEAKKTYSRLESEQRRLQFENEDLRRQIVEYDRHQASEKIRSLS